MELLLFLLISLTCSYAVKQSNGGGDLQGEIEDYLRTLTHSQPAYRESNSQPVLDDMRKYLSLRSQAQALHYMPPDRSIASGYAGTSMNGGRLQQQPWPGLIMPEELKNGASRSFASSSVHVKKPEGSEEEIDAEGIAFASVRDVDAEDHIADSQVQYDKSFSEVSTSKPVKDSENVQHTNEVPNPMARKSDTLSTAHHDTVPIKAEKNFSDVYFVAIVAGCTAAGIFGIISAGICFYRLQKNSKASADVDYPAYGVTGPSKDSGSPNGDRKLAQSAQMYHYQHQKQQMIAVEKAGSTKHTSASDVDSEEENEEGRYTVYECPGLAPTGEMEVKNPLFNDDSTPMSPAVLPTKPESIQSK